LTDNTPESWFIEVLNPSSGSWRLDFTDPKTGNVWKSDEINANGSASHVRYRIQGFFTSGSRSGSNIDVERTMLDAEGNETTVTADAQKYVYKVMLHRRIDGYSFTNYSTATYGTIASTITVFPPNSERGTMSSKPLGGEFVLKCPDEDGVFHSTNKRSINEWDVGLQL
jgi:hypothetical protein